MRYQVPQFIDVEDKIFGPLTFKQFIYVVGGAGICVMLFIFLPRFIAIILSLPVALFAAALAFYKVNNRPFVIAAEAFVKYLFTNKLYIWRKMDREVISGAASAQDSGELRQVYVPKLSDSKLKELSWSLDIKENRNPVTEDQA